MNIAVVDSVFSDLERTKLCVEQCLEENYHKDFQIRTFHSAFELLSSFDRNTYDLFILETSLQDMNGFELTKVLRKQQDFCVVIFVTASECHALEAYEVGAIQYLLKPLNQGKLRDILIRLMKIFEPVKEKFIFLKTDDGMRKFDVDTIIFIETSGHFQNFYFNEEVVSCRMTGHEADHMMSGYEQFARVHQSYIVNMNRIRAVRDQMVLLDSKDEVLISKRRRAEFRSIFSTYCDNRKR